ncbi:MAG TPA: GNAT family N-acetyltransferase [Streptosporangiaceae bacterium]|jgi:GNAT superfamily N-acetyltransferase
MEQTATTIQVAAPDEAAAVVAMYRWLFEPPGGEPPGWDEDRAAVVVRRIAASPRADVLVARRGGELVGLCSVYLDVESVRFGQRAWVADLAVHPGYRSRGIGKSLLDGARAWARAREATHLALDTADSRQDAQRFYERERPSWRSVCYTWAL